MNVAPPDPAIEFARRVVADVDATWARDFQKRGKPYTPMAASLFAEAGACAAAVGSENCSTAAKSDVDLLFQRRLQERFGDAGKARKNLGWVPRTRTCTGLASCA